MAGTLISAGTSVLGSVAGSAVSSIFGGSSASDATTAAATAADPFASQRAQYQPMLQQLVTNPNSVLDTAESKYLQEQGMNSVNAGAGASGMLNSGNRLLALQKEGQGLAATTYQQQFNNLATLSGATSGSSATSAQILANQASSQASGASALGGSIGNLITSGLNTAANSLGQTQEDTFFGS